MNTKYLILLLTTTLAALLSACSTPPVEEQPTVAVAVPTKSFKPRYLTRIPVPDMPLSFPD